MKIIAVDYDDTITEIRPYPEIAPLNKKAKKYLDKLNDLGYILVLFSARNKKWYDEAYNRCINEFNLTYIKKDSKEFEHGSTGKLVADFYIDDKSYVDKKIPWKKIYKYLKKNK